MMGSMYLEGGFGPVREELTLTDLPVTGAIPDFLDGRYLRNGPNPIAEVDPETYNWFAGDGMVHGLRIRDGKAEWYRNRFVRNAEVSARRGEQPPRISRRAGYGAVGANTNVIRHAGRTLALVEAGVANFELSDELDTIGTCDFDGTLPGGYTAHPLRDPVSGELHAISYFFGRGNTVQYSVIGKDGRARRRVDIEVGGSPMMHGFALTKQNVLIFDLPVTFDPRQAAAMTVPRPLRWTAQMVLSGLIGRVPIPDPIGFAMAQRAPGNSGFPYRWDDSYPARIGVLPREGAASEVRWFEIDPCYIFHQANAYEDGSTIVLDAVRHERVFDNNLLGPTEGAPTMNRWILDLSSGRVSERLFDDRTQEFPRIDERLIGRRHRYAYAPVMDGIDGHPAGTLLKHDLAAGSTASKDFGPGKELGEFVFEPGTPDAAEDDGVLIGFVYDRATDRSNLTFVDAGTLETVAAVHLPTRVPHGFHGNWIPETR